MPQVKIKQGTKSSINNNTGVLNAGTLAVTTDTNELFFTHNDGTLHQLCDNVNKSGDTMTGNLNMSGNSFERAGFEVVTSLPTTNRFVGRQVTYQGRSYIWDGSEWKCDSDTLGGYGSADYYKPLKTGDFVTVYDGNLSEHYSTYLGAINSDLFSKFSEASKNNCFVEKFDEVTETWIRDDSLKLLFISGHSSSIINNNSTHKKVRLTFAPLSPFNYAQISNVCFRGTNLRNTTIQVEQFLSVEQTWVELFNGSLGNNSSRFSIVKIPESKVFYNGTGTSYIHALRLTIYPSTYSGSWALYNSGFLSKVPSYFSIFDQYLGYNINGDVLFRNGIISNETINFNTNNIEPTQTGTVTKTSTWTWQYLTQSMNYSWLKLKTWVGGLFSAGSATTNNNYLPKIDDVNKKLVKSNINDDGTTPKYGSNTIWHSGNDGSSSGLDADMLDGKHATDFATSTHNHDTKYLGLTAKAADSNKLDGKDSTDFSLVGHTHDYSASNHNHDTKYLGLTAKASDSAKLGGELPSYYEPAFTKNTAFNKDFGTGVDDVASGDHGHSELHTHSNKTTLDAITAAFTTALKTNYDTAYNNSHTHSNKTVLDAFTTALKSSYDGAVTNSHTHGNKTVLDALTQAIIDNSHTHSNSTALGNVSGTNTGDETTLRIGTLINGATAKTTPVNADMVGLMDSAASNKILKKLSWANIKATLKTYFDTLYATSAQGTKADNALPSSSYTANDVLSKLITVDGPSSGLNADLLDGKHASEFATSTHDHDVYEANLKWGGRNISGGYSPIDAAMVDELGANRLAFANPAGITIEYSTDGGDTWLDYGASDSVKSSLTATATSLYTGKSTSNLTASPLNMLRVTFDTGVCQVYTALNKIVIYCSTNGAQGSYVTIQKALQSTPNNYINHVENIPISGWAGYNVINIPNLTTYGNSPTVQYGRLRFIFGYTGYAGTSSSHRGLYVGGIKGFGGVGWTTPSNMAKRNSLFTYDGLQNAFFPALVRSNETINFDTNNIEPTQSGTVTKTSTWLWQYLVQSVNWLKANIFTKAGKLTNVVTITNFTTFNPATLGLAVGEVLTFYSYNATNRPSWGSSVATGTIIHAYSGYYKYIAYAGSSNGYAVGYYHSSSFQGWDLYDAQGILDLIKTVDGPNSGLNADLLDGKHASDFVTSVTKAMVENVLTGVITSHSHSDNDTKNTAGATNTSSKIYLVGSTAQTANPQTYTHDTAYVDVDGSVYSGSSKTITVSDLETNKIVTPTLNPTWTIRNYAGTAVSSPKNPSGSAISGTSIILEYGFKPSMTVKGKWVSQAGYDNPTSCSGLCGTSLPASNVETASTASINLYNPTTYSSTVVPTTPSAYWTISTPKKGITISGSSLVLPIGNISASARVQVTYQLPIYYGNITSLTITETNVKGLTTKTWKNYHSNSKSESIKINSTDSQYWIYAYPAAWGNLSTISNADGDWTAAFTTNTVSITGAPGLPITYNYYITVNKGAFKNKTINFS